MRTHIGRMTQRAAPPHATFFVNVNGLHASYSHGAFTYIYI